MAFVGALTLAFAVGLIGVALSMHVGGGSIRGGKDLQLTLGLLMAQIVVYIPLAGVALVLLPYAARRSLREIGLHPPEAADVRAGLLGAIAMYVVAEAAALLQKFAFHVSGTQAAVQLFGTTHDRGLIYGLIALAVVFAPFVEELIFRGFVFNALLRYTPVGIAAAISGIVFGIAHYDKAAFFPLACGGAVLAFVYYRTGSLVSSMLTHSTFNAVNVALVLATGGKG